MEPKSDKIINEIQTIKGDTFGSLTNQKILFGHASVGNNIISGINNILTHNKSFQNINVRELKSGDNIDKNGIYHVINGKNNFPKTKCDNFLKLLTENNIGSKLDIAFFKFCYVDFQKNTDINELFDYYVDNIEEINKEFPDLKIIHVTVPLYIHAGGLKGLIKKFLKPDIANVKRNEFNDLLREKYKDKEPIYDLAKIESTYADGRRESFNYKGKSYYSLAKPYSDDGGHLNEIGSFYAGKKLLSILAELPLNKKDHIP